jgi:AcrR family transcriptional regulator
MEDTEFDRALVAAAFDLIAQSGWRNLSVADAARAADLPLDRARARFPCRLAVLARFEAQADQAALTGIVEDSTVRDRLLGIVMSRIDVLQSHRAGVIALLRDLPRDPLTTLALAPVSLRSMRWMLEGARIETGGWRGPLRIQGMLGVWLYTVNAWRSDESEDLSATMAALDRALNRAEQAEASLAGM